MKSVAAIFVDHCVFWESEFSVDPGVALTEPPQPEGLTLGAMLFLGLVGLVFQREGWNREGW